MRKTLVPIAVTLLVGAGLVTEGCGSDKAEEGDTNLPPRSGTSSSSGGASGTLEGGASSGSSGSSGSNADCTNHAKVDDRPACDQCTKAKCCAQIIACDESAACQAVQDCFAGCAPDDIFCGLTCAAGDTDGKLAAVGQCAKSKCASECPSTIPDGGFGDAF